MAPNPPNGPEIRLRTYRPSDVRAVRSLWRAAGLHLGPSDRPDALERARRRDPDLFLVAVERGRLVGVVLGRFDGRRGWVNHLAVDVRARRRGLGSRLMGEVERRMARKGCRKVNLHVVPENREVTRFYEGLGYEVRPLVFLEKWLRGRAPTGDGDRTTRNGPRKRRTR
jgi:ribosomal protein S18 acetylase RimI-like enzyme